jgi:dienelactone hydrolase
LPFVRSSGVVIVGQSAGGWGTIAYDSIAHPKVSAFVVMAGGRGGHMHEEPNRNCHPERLAQAAGRFGKTATTPMLWVYAMNDTFFRPEIARAMYQSFTGSGGHADFVQPAPFGRDGHALFFGSGGSAIWGPIVQSYLGQKSVDAP